MRLTTRSRLDISDELRDAIAARAIQTRCVGRHDLASGALVAVLAYARWIHPLRGDVAPAEFLNAAEVTGEALTLSRALLRSLRDDIERLAPKLDSNVAFSFGPLRRHLLHSDFHADLKAFLEPCTIPAARLEIRIAESVFISLPPSLCLGIKALGAQIMVDEVGRGPGSLDSLARAPISGVQLDRTWVNSICADDVSRRVCGAGIALAKALLIRAAAAGVDSAAQRQVLLDMGCQVGSGDVFGDARLKSYDETSRAARGRRSKDVTG